MYIPLIAFWAMLIFCFVMGMLTGANLARPRKPHILWKELASDQNFRLEAKDEVPEMVLGPFNEHRPNLVPAGWSHIG